MDWLISATATILALCAYWLYGNRTWKAPLLSLVVCALWVYYDLRYDQIPLLLPTVMTATVATRNLIKMRRER